MRYQQCKVLYRWKSLNEEHIWVEQSGDGKDANQRVPSVVGRSYVAEVTNDCLGESSNYGHEKLPSVPCWMGASS
jgi:hypothetical protein